MRFPLSWLKDYLITEASADDIYNALNDLGIEVEHINLHVSDPIFEVAITPNLSHCASIFGLARELLAVLQGKLIQPKLDYSSNLAFDLKVQNEDVKKCMGHAYVIVHCSEVETPEWMKQRLLTANIQPRYFSVDVTNYVLLELGHPLHAYDLKKLPSDQIVVRQASRGTPIELIDGQTLHLTSEDLVIHSGEEPIALAGVMGGSKSAVTHETTSILIEAALFDPVMIRKTCKYHHLISAAARLFEKGIDPKGCERALQRALYLIQKYGSGQCSEIEKEVVIPVEKTLQISLPKINHLLGTACSVCEVEIFFQRLNLQPKTMDEIFEVTIPTYRQDLKIEVDLIEEVARLYGFEQIFEITQPVYYQASSLDSHPKLTLIQNVTHYLLTEGLQEWVTCNLISAKFADFVMHDLFDHASTIELLNPSSSHYRILRTSLLPNFLHLASNNMNHKILNISGFEVGYIHFKEKEAYRETLVASILCMGGVPATWNTKGKGFDFFDLKGIVERLLFRFGLTTVTFDPSNFENFHPGRQAKLSCGSKIVGILGQLHPFLLSGLDLPEQLFFAEINLEALAPSIQDKTLFQPLPVYPGSTRDWTITVPTSLSFSVLKEASQYCISELQSVSLLDVYLDEKLGSSQKNVTLRFEYRAFNKTLSDTQVDQIHQKVVSHTKEALNKIL